ncbi:hypothetical protein MAR_002344, partial [Mya arenaria]
GPQNFLDTYLPYVSWTGKQQVLAEIWRDMFTHNPVDEVTALLVTSAVLERALGDVYMLKGPAPFPSMMKDLLVTEQLMEILGEDVVYLVPDTTGTQHRLSVEKEAGPSADVTPETCGLSSHQTHNRYGESSALLLYYLEQGLRLATTLYTTFDE